LAERKAIPTSQVKPKKSAEIVAGRLRLAIVNGDISRGEMLPVERDLIESFGVSRATMREALRILETEGLLEVARGAKGGARILGPTLALASHAVGMVLQAQGTQLADVQIARQIIEPPAARMVAERSARERKQIVKKLIEALEAERAALDDADFPYKAMAFHETLVQLSGNRTLSTFLLVLHEIHEGVAAAMSQHSGRNRIREKTLDFHAQLIAIVRQGDGDAAESLWREYWQWITPYTHPDEAIVDVLRNLS